MPFKTAIARREYQRVYKREKTAARRKLEAQEAAPSIVTPDDPVDALRVWSEETLLVPPGHPRAGEPMALPSYILDFLRDAWNSKEALLCMGRKNAKSSGVAVLCLGLLVGPLRQPGLRIGVASISKEKAAELKQQIEDISKASGLDDLTFYRSPSPGKIVSSTGTLDLLASETGGHASGFDLVIVDELGLMRESERAFVASLRSSTSAKDGRFVALSIWGSGPYVPEMVARKDDEDVAVHLYQSARDCALDDQAAWHAANPGLKAGIKSMDYMQREARRVLSTPSDQGLFRAFDLNCPQDPAREMICTLTDFKQCRSDASRDGHCVIAWDCGGSDSMTAFCAVWPWTGRCEIYAGFAGTPSLKERGEHDGVGLLYQQFHDAGELEVFEGRITPVAVFLEQCLARLDGEQILLAGCDRYRKAEAQTALSNAGLEGLPVTWRGQGASATADGSHDCRSFQRLVLQHKLRVVKGAALLAHAISESSVRRDSSGNPALAKGRDRGRIDALQAAVIACGLAELVEAKGKPTPSRLVIA